jgi:secreted PhoX family phosphatase
MRRRFLKSLGALAALPPLEAALGPLAARVRAEGPVADSPFARFAPIEPTDRDALVLPDGFVHDVVLKWGDPFTADGRTFGYNNDWIGVFPGDGADDLVLVVNHEYISLAYGGDAALYPQTFEMLRGRRPEVDDQKRDVGCSVVRVRRDGDGRWQAILGDPLNRRIDAFTPMRADGPAAGLLGGGVVEGTFDNCGGQVTPWGTALTCEENFDQRVPAQVDGQGRFATGGVFNLPGGHYGWVVEFDPLDPGSVPVKHTALGRFRHENVGLRVTPGRPVVCYMGDDRLGGHVWKFVSNFSYRPGDPGNRHLLAAGRLFAARFAADGRGEWIPLELRTELDPNPDPKDPKPFIPRGAKRLRDCYASPGAMLLDAYQAANAIGATPSGRPEDLEVHPADGSVFISFTAAPGRSGPWQNPFGEVWRIVEKGGDPLANRFRWERFCVGARRGERAGAPFAQPDNIAIDSRGDLWLTTDLSSDVIHVHPDYVPLGNSGLFRLGVLGARRGAVEQFASLPCEAEPTGPAFAPGEQALFLSVQHPGERWGTRRRAEDSPKGSNWPLGLPGAPPQPAVVAIRRG